MYFPGPQYEIPAEVRAARLLGADVLDQPLSGEEVIAAGQAAGPRFSALVKACLARL